MTCSKMMVFVACGALALAMTGCKYDDVGEAGDGTDTALASDVSEQGQDSVSGADLATVTGADGVPATELKFDQDPNYERCTDVEFEPVYFGFDASNLPAGEMGKIEAVAAHLQSNPTRVVIVEGNCDERGSNEYNLSLGELRAVAIQNYLQTLGIAANRIQTKSYGEEKPAVVGQTEEAYAKNRRGEFAVFKHK